MKFLSSLKNGRRGDQQRDRAVESRNMCRLARVASRENCPRKRAPGEGGPLSSRLQIKGSWGVFEKKELCYIGPSKGLEREKHHHAKEGSFEGLAAKRALEGGECLEKVRLGRNSNRPDKRQGQRRIGQTNLYERKVNSSERSEEEGRGFF